jgi:hypothetical protein
MPDLSSGEFSLSARSATSAVKRLNEGLLPTMPDISNTIATDLGTRNFSSSTVDLFDLYIV